MMPVGAIFGKTTSLVKFTFNQEETFNSLVTNSNKEKVQEEKFKEEEKFKKKEEDCRAQADKNPAPSSTYVGFK